MQEQRVLHRDEMKQLQQTIQVLRESLAQAGRAGQS